MVCGVWSTSDSTVNPFTSFYFLRGSDSRTPLSSSRPPLRFPGCSRRQRVVSHLGRQKVVCRPNEDSPSVQTTESAVVTTPTPTEPDTGTVNDHELTPTDVRVEGTSRPFHLLPQRGPLRCTTHQPPGRRLGQTRGRLWTGGTGEGHPNVLEGPGEMWIERSRHFDLLWSVRRPSDNSKLFNYT